MDIINSGIGRTRRKLWLYGSIALALIVGMTLLVGTNRVSAHEGLDSSVAAGGIVQAYDAERDEHVVHFHASSVTTWEIYTSSSSRTCNNVVSGWRHAGLTQRSRTSDSKRDIIAEADGITLTLGSSDNGLDVCIRYATTDVNADAFDSTSDWTYSDADSNTDGSQSLEVDLQGPKLTVSSAESNAMEVEVDGLKEGSVALRVEDVSALTDAVAGNMRIRYAFLDSAACDATTLTDDTRYSESTSLISDTFAVVTTPQAKDGLKFSIATAWSMHGKHLCVEVTDQVGNAGYGSKMVDVDFPLTLTQVPSTGTDGEGRVSASSSESGIKFSYSSNVGVYQETTVDCSSKPMADSYVFRPSIPGGGYKYDANTAVVCILARDSMNNEIRIAFVIDKTAPTITAVLQSNQIVRVIGSDAKDTTTAEAAGADVIRSSEGQIRWESRYIDALAADGDDPDPGAALQDACTAENFRGSSSTYATYTTGTRNTKIDLSSNSAWRDRYDAICFRIRDVANQEVYQGVVVKDFTVQPVIDGSRDEMSPRLQLSITGVEGSVAWSWVATTLAAECNSEEADTFNFSEPSPDSVITVASDAVAYCVRATIGTTNYYGLVLGVAEGEAIDSDGPTVTIADVDSNNMVSASADDDTGSGVDANSWQYTILVNEDAARDNCKDEPISVISDDAWMSGNSFTATAAHSNKYVCFRVMDEVGNYGYASASLPTIEDTVKPTLEVTQSGNTLVWNAQDEGGIATYEYQMFDSAPANCDTDSGWMDGMKTTLAESDNGKHYCFRVTDHGDNMGHDGPLAISGVDTTRPTVTVSQSGNTVNAVPGELDTSGWQYYRSDEDPGDNCSDRYTSWSDVKMVEDGRQVTGLTAADSGKWLCFRVMDAAGNYGYKKFQIETITEAQEDARVTSDGSLAFSLEGRRLMVSLNPAEGETEAPEVVSWNYLYWSTESLARSYCTPERNQFDTANPGVRNDFNVAQRHLGNWFCFRAIDENNEEAFGVFQVPADVTDTTMVDGTTPETGTETDQQPVIDPTVDDGTDDTTGDTTGDAQQPGQPGDTGTTDDGTTDDGTTDDGTTDDGTTDTGTTDDGTTTDPGTTDDEGGFLSDYLWYIIGAIVVVILIVVFVAMGSKGNQRE